MEEIKNKARSVLGWDQLELKQAAYYLGDLAHLAMPEFDNAIIRFRGNPRSDMDYYQPDVDYYNAKMWNGTNISKFKRVIIEKLFELQSACLYEGQREGEAPELYKEDVLQLIEATDSLVKEWRKRCRMVAPEDYEMVDALFQNIFLQLDEVYSKTHPRPKISNCTIEEIREGIL